MKIDKNETEKFVRKFVGEKRNVLKGWRKRNIWMLWKIMER